VPTEKRRAQNADDLTLAQATVQFWRWRADHCAKLGALHRARGDHLRAADCQNRARSLAVRLGEPARYVASVLELLEMAVEGARPDAAAEYLFAILESSDAVNEDLRRLYAGLDALLRVVPGTERDSATDRVLQLADRQSAEASALARLSVARWRRGQGRPASGLSLLAAPAAWASQSGDTDAEVAIRSEMATCLMALGRVSEAARAFELNLHLLEATPGCPPDALAVARRNWEVARARASSTA
jgi:hypothetical protein